MTHIASCSFGKDSLAMVLLLMERGYPLDEVMFYDTGMEFQAIYNIRDKMLPIFTQAGIKYTELRPQNSFLYDMLDRPVISKQKGSHLGYGWCGGVCRWGTTFKTQSLDAHADGAARHYVGIAADETDRLNRLVAPRHAPLAEVGMTESDCLAYCRAKGFSWGEGDVDLYDILDRVSCWCCENKNFKELKNIYCYLPKYWEKLKWMQARIERPMKKWRNKKYGAYGNVFDMERVFADGIMKEPDHAE